MHTKTKELIKSYIIATVGLFFVALGVALSIVSNLGTAPLSCPGYVLHLGIPSLSVGTFTFIVNMLYLIVQLLILGRRFKLEHLTQIITSLIFGYMIDLSMLAVSWMSSSNLIIRLLICLLAAVVTAVGISIEVAANAWMLSAEMTVAAVVTRFKGNFGTIKIVMDSLLVLVSALLCFAFFRNIFGIHYFGLMDALLAKYEGVVVGIGTILLAFLPGYLMRFTDPWIRKIIKKSGQS